MTIRIGVDAHVLTGKFQGSRTYLLNLLRELGKLDTANRYILYSFDPGVTHNLLDFPNFEHRHLRMHAAMPRLLFYWPWEQWQAGLDLLLTSYFTPLIFPNRQLVIVHDVLFESHRQYFKKIAGWRFRVLVRICAQRARAVLAVSNTTRQEILTRYGLSESCVHLVRGGIDRAGTLVDPSRPPPDGGPYVLAVGRLEPRKNLPALLRAFRLMRSPGVRLVVIGKEDFGAALVAAALRDLQIDPDTKDRVTWLTDVTDVDLPWYYRHAAVFAFPSFAEGFGLPLLEALVHGTPIVASGHPAMREVGGAFGRYFQPDAPDADTVFASLLDQAIAAGRLPPSAALSTHLDSFAWARSARTMLKIISDTTAGRDRRTAFEGFGDSGAKKGRSTRV